MANGELCSVCKKRLATVFMTQIDKDGNQINKGLCLVCAKKMGLPQVTKILEQMGISDEELEAMTDGMNSLMAPQEGGEILDDTDSDNDTPSGTNTPNLFNMFNNLSSMFPHSSEPPRKPDNQKDGGKNDKKNAGEKKPEFKFLSTYSTDLTKKAMDGKIDNVVGRSREIQRMIQILNRRTKNNPVLIGEAGVGKTAIAEGLALAIARGEAPEKLLNLRVHLLDLTAMVAGTQFRGQFESRMKGVIDEVKRAGNIVLVIDEVHNIMGAGEAEGSLNAANILKPALSRGEIQVIGATTLKEYRKFIEKDSALERRFQPIYVNEPTIEETIDILKGIRVHYEVYHKVHISDRLIEDAVRMSERYIADRFLPDKAIDVIDEAASRANLRNPVLPQIAEVNRQIAEVNQQIADTEAKEFKNDEERNEGFREIAELKSKLAVLQNRLNELSEHEYMDIIFDDIAKVIETWTGIPVQTISADEAKRLLTLEERLKKNVIGQDEAISSLAKAIRRNRSGFRNKFKPSSFIFVGPTGVGKTELVKQLTIELFGTIEALVRLDMSEYMEKHTVSKLIGSPPGYVGFDEAGQLTEKIRRRPYSVILLDEIEKAHADVYNMLLQILDDGRLTDSQGRTVNFENTIIIMTSNAGTSLKSVSLGFNADQKNSAVEMATDALKNIFRPEFLNRVDETIVFNKLSKDNLIDISKIIVGRVVSQCQEKGVALNITEAVYEYLAEHGYDEKYGARPLARLVEKEIEDILADMYLQGKLEVGTKLTLDVNEGRIVIS